jgi:uncharacterized protein
MLKLSLAAVAREGQQAQWVIPLDDPLWEGAGLSLIEPVHVSVEALSIGSDSVLVRGRIRTTVELECRRCLTRVEQAIDEPVDLLFEAVEEEEEAELAGEVYPLPSRGDELDLSAPIREHLLLHVPDLVVCREECRGLCTQCGADLNEAPCDCAPPARTGAWDALKNLKFD